LVSFNHVTDLHFVTFSSSLYATIRNPNLILTITITQPGHNHNRNATVITDPQIGPIDPQIVTVLIRSAPHFVACLQSSSQITTTNIQTPSFLQAGCPFCQSTNSVKVMKGNLPHIIYMYLFEES